MTNWRGNPFYYIHDDFYLLCRVCLLLKDFYEERILSKFLRMWNETNLSHHWDSAKKWNNSLFSRKQWRRRRKRKFTTKQNTDVNQIFFRNIISVSWFLLSVFRELSHNWKKFWIFFCNSWEGRKKFWDLKKKTYFVKGNLIVSLMFQGFVQEKKIVSSSKFKFFILIWNCIELLECNIFW